jgi:hypothetical protein
MSIDLAKLSPSDYAAWWGAIIATLTLIWSIVAAIRSGARLHVTASPNMKIYPEDPHAKSKSYILVRAVNRGTSSTTITHFRGYCADTIFDLTIKSKRKHFIVNGTTDGKPVPHIVAPGEEWHGVANQTAILDGFKGKYLYIGVIHNQSKRPIYKRVKLNA